MWLGRTDRPYSFASPCPGEEFALLVVIGDDAVSVDEQASLAEQFVRQGCRYAVCAGHGCSSWDDAIDMVGVMDEIDSHPGPLVMTTWHEGEALVDVVEYFAGLTTFDDWVPAAFVALVIGGPRELEAEVRAALEERFGRRM